MNYIRNFFGFPEEGDWWTVRFFGRICCYFLVKIIFILFIVFVIAPLFGHEVEIFFHTLEKTDFAFMSHRINLAEVLVIIVGLKTALILLYLSGKLYRRFGLLLGNTFKSVFR